MERLLIAILVLIAITSTALGNKLGLADICAWNEAGAKDAAKIAGDLAIKLYRQVAKPEENMVFSPASIAVALALLDMGAVGTTKDEIEALISQKGSKDSPRLYPSYKALQYYLQLKKETTQVNLVNGLFLSDLLMPFKLEFSSFANSCYGAPVLPNPFKTNPERARADINQWISDQTEKQVDQLFKKGAIDENTIVALGSSAHLTASWPEEMKMSKSSFYRSGKNDQSQMVNFMTHQGDYGHYAGDNFEALELPFSDIPLHLYVILPKQRDGLVAVEKSLTGDQVIGLGEKVKRRLVSLKVPDFVLRQSIDLAAVLDKLGVKQVFTDQSNLSDMTAKKAKAKISKAVHEVYLKLNGHGANTVMETKTAQGSNVVGPKTPEPAVPFIADHPFIFAIVHKQTGAIVYLGRVNSVDKQE